MKRLACLILTLGVLTMPGCATVDALRADLSHGLNHAITVLQARLDALSD